jgi:hypothetical protein
MGLAPAAGASLIGGLWRRLTGHGVARAEAERLLLAAAGYARRLVGD